GSWGPEAGFPVEPGYNVSTTFDVTVADTAPVGDYTVTLQLVRASAPDTVLAQETGTIAVHPNEAMVLWGSPLPKLVTQGVSTTVPLQVYSPQASTGQLDLTIVGPGDDPATEQTEVTKAGDVKIYASNGTDMVAMPLTLNADGALVGSWTASLDAGYTPVTWYATVATGALVGNYAFTVTLAGGNTLSPLVIAVSAPETHGQKPPDAGVDTTAPVVSATAVGELGSTASFTLSANEDPVTFECQLTTNTVAGLWEACTSPKTYTDLLPGDYVFSVRGTDGAGNVSAVVSKSWTVAAPDTTAPVVTVTPVNVLGATASFTLAADEDSATFECQLTRNGTVVQAWAACTSPQAYSNLAEGDYVFSARATDAAGNVSTVVTKGWSVKATVVAEVRSDFTGDGNADLLARDRFGQLWLYPGNGHGRFLSRVRLGSGWNAMTALVGPGDFTGNGTADLLARDRFGQLWLYPGNGHGRFLSRVRLGGGWNAMTAFIG
ncbi:MAG TPA: VCBS repeat-containing protein, partial [Angustibacter sp.]|nr:VCBS repeat-containing protein [Angustibacter sp.]